MDWSEKDICIKCNEGGNLLVCSEDGCPLAVHKGCMGFSARFDDAGRFYCPYCLYKQAVAESRQAREYALARKKALLLFMDEKTMGSEKHTEENKREYNARNESKISESNKKIVSYEDCKSKSNVDADQPIQLDVGHKISNAEEERVQEEESEASGGSKSQESSLKLHKVKSISCEEEKQNHGEGQSVSNEEEKKNQGEEQNISREVEKSNREEEHETSAASSGHDHSPNMHDHKICNNEEEKKIEEKVCENFSASTGEQPSCTMQTRAKRGSKRRKPVHRDSEAGSVRHKLHKQLDKSKSTSPAVNTPRKFSKSSSSMLKTEKGIVGSSKNSKQPEKPPIKLASDVFGSGKRKRVLWTEEEEEALKVGVEKYSKEGKNIPWRKILDEDTEVFDATRTPGDLKDKWRNMSAK